MPFLFDFYLNNEELSGVEIGFTLSRKWEEALDEAKLAIPFYESDVPYSQYGLLKIEITEIDNFEDRTELDSETLEMLIISDMVSLSSQYGIYRHDISAIEYSAKLDVYMMASLAKTRFLESDATAKFELTDYGKDFTYSFTSTKIVQYSPFWLPSFKPKKTYFSNVTYTFSKVDLGYLIIEPNATYDYLGEFIRMPIVFRIHNIESGVTSGWYELSDDDQEITFTENGNYYIEYGFQATQSFWVGATGTTPGYRTAGYYEIFRFYTRVYDEYELTMYNLIDSVRRNVSKHGGIESLEYFDDTRIFDIDPSVVDYLKTIQVPQTYLSQATARQMLIFSLSYINSIPRLEYGSGLDTLKIEEYNLSTGVFTEQNTYSRSASQNVNQIGTRSYTPLKQVLPNNMDEPTTFSPSQNGFQQVRATDLQITDSSFSVKLPKEIYTPKEFVLYVPNINVAGLDNTGDLNNYDIEDIEVDLLTRTINIEEWKLKYVTDNFPTISSYNLWDEYLGLRENMVDNLYWKLGSKEINLSDVYGTIVNRTLFNNVIKLSIFEELMLNMVEPIIIDDYGSDMMFYQHLIDIDIDFLTDTDAYRDLRFRFSYLSLEDLVIKNDKEDLSQIDFYSEMRQNQDESIINVVRASRKKHGNLQRTGNKVLSFSKVHHTLDEAYKVGQKDKNGYTITTVIREFFANFYLASYFITRYHNRESRQSVIDQTYRWRDNYAKSVFDRHENYSDYIILYPPSESGIGTEVTKIDNVEIIFKLLLGETITDFKTRASAAIIRTDGMFSIEAEQVGAYYGILTNVSAYPIKQGLAFTMGFDSNLVAGNGLVLRDSNYYNQAVRYTDEDGRFSYFGFSIFSNFELDNNDYETFPKITRDTTYSLITARNPYFKCGSASLNVAGSDALVVDKDPLTNFKLTYQVNILSYYVGLYVIGQGFYTENFVVNNPDEDGTYKAYLYLYKDGTEYGIFEDLKIKSGYDSETMLSTSNIELLQASKLVSFKSTIDLTDVTSWAIGNKNGDLYIACNESLNGFKYALKHFRPNVKEIGNKDII